MSWTLPEDRSLWPEDLRSEFEERAAILEFEAKLPRAIAERKARYLILHRRMEEENR